MTGHRIEVCSHTSVTLNFAVQVSAAAPHGSHTAFGAGHCGVLTREHCCAA
jgi:hypothetical protein